MFLFLCNKLMCVLRLHPLRTAASQTANRSSPQAPPPAGIRVVSNAGGVNPLACAAAIQEVVKKAGLNLKVAVVTGDDLIPHVRTGPGESVTMTLSVHRGAHFSLCLSVTW